MQIVWEMVFQTAFPLLSHWMVKLPSVSVSLRGTEGVFTGVTCIIGIQSQEWKMPAALEVFYKYHGNCMQGIF